VEWIPDNKSGKHKRRKKETRKKRQLALLKAISCAAFLVAKCSDFSVHKDDEKQIASTLNLHCAIGFGKVVGVHVGDKERKEYLIIGDTVRQVSDAMTISKLGEVVASNEAVSMLQDLVRFKSPVDTSKKEPQVVATKEKALFKVKKKSRKKLSKKKKTRIESLTKLYSKWDHERLELLRSRMAPYVHPVVVADELRTEDDPHRTEMCTSQAKQQNIKPELRDVFTVFIQPKVNVDLNGKEASHNEVRELLNNIMLLVKSEASIQKGHLRQMIVDDKGLVVMVNFGLRGSTFPNM